MIGARTLHVALFFLTFTLDVRVHAKEYVQLPNQEQVLQQPEDCLLQTTVCSIKTSANFKFKLTVGNEIVVLDSDTAVLRLGRDRIRLLSGTVWVQEKSSFIVETVYGEVVSPGGEFWISQSPDRTWVRATGPTLKLHPRSSYKAIALEKGEENWLGPVQKNGVGSSGIPQAIAWKDHLIRWSRLYPEGKKKFTADVKAFRSSWVEACERISTYHQGLADRRIASLKEQDEQLARRHKAEEAYDRNLRELFRKKVWDD